MLYVILNKQNAKRTEIMKTGDKIKVRLSAIHSSASESNPIKEKVIDFCRYYESGELDYFTFKGGKTLYRIGGHRGVFSITGPDRNYEIIK